MPLAEIQSFCSAVVIISLGQGEREEKKTLLMWPRRQHRFHDASNSLSYDF